MRGLVKKYLLLVYTLCTFLFVVGCTAESQTDAFSDSITLTPTVRVEEMTPTELPTETPIPTGAEEPTEAPVPTEAEEQTTPIPSPTVTLLPTATSSPSPTPLPTATPSLSPTPLPTATPSPSPTPLPTATPSPSPTPLPTATPSPSPTPLPTATPTPSPSPKPTATPTPAPLLNTSSFNVGVFDAYPLAGNYADGIADIDWVSSDPSIVQVFGNDIIGMNPGTATITGTYKGSTVTADVTVYNSGRKSNDVLVQTENICLFPGEDFQLVATQKDAVFSSADSSVATVAPDGTVTGVSIGTTTITAANANSSVDCTVTVVADDGTYLKSTLPTEYLITKECVVMASDSFYLCVDAGVCLPDNVLDKIELIMATMEKETGLSFSNPKLSGFPPLTKPTISVINSTYDSAYAHSYGIVLAPYDIYLDENGISVIVHELLHTLQLRNGIDLGNALSEGFAMYYCDMICEKLPFPKNHDEYYNSWVCMGQFDEITLENTESSLLNPPDIHPFSYFFVQYLAKTYGDQKIYTIIDAITEAVQRTEENVYAGQVNPLSEEAIYEIIKAHTSDNLTEEFYRYFSSLEEPDWPYMDLSDVDGTYYVDYTGTRMYNITSVNGLVKFNQEITLDYTYAFDYAEKVWGRKTKGISLRAFVIDDQMMHEVDTTFYDQYNNVIRVSDLDEAFQNVVPGAVKVTLRGVDECICHVSEYDMFGE